MTIFLIVLCIVFTILCILLLIANHFVKYSLISVDGKVAANDEKAPQPLNPKTVAANKKEDRIAFAKWDALHPSTHRIIIAQDGLKLYAKQYIHPTLTHKWAFLFHGYGVEHSEIVRYASHFYDMGLNVLIPDQRAHGKSEGTIIGMGYLEQHDITAWIQDIIMEDTHASIALYGQSMGAASVCMCSNHPLASNVKLIIEDCGYTNAYDMFVSQLRYRFHLPEFPIMSFARIVAKHKIGYDLKKANPLHCVQKASIPMLFIHGDTDLFVPVHMAYTLYDACTSKDKRLCIVSGADHAESIDMDPIRVYGEIKSMIDTYV